MVATLIHAFGHLVQLRDVVGRIALLYLRLNQGAVLLLAVLASGVSVLGCGCLASYEHSRADVFEKASWYLLVHWREFSFFLEL